MPTITTRITPRQHSLASAHALERGLSVNALVCIALDAYFSSQPMPEQTPLPPSQAHNEPVGAPGLTGGMMPTPPYPLPPALVQAYADNNGVKPLPGAPSIPTPGGKKLTFKERQRALDLGVELLKQGDIEGAALQNALGAPPTSRFMRPASGTVGGRTPPPEKRKPGTSRKGPGSLGGDAATS